MAVILQMRERMEEMQRQMQEFVNYVGKEILSRAPQADAARGAIVPIRRAAPSEPPSTRSKQR